MMIFIFIEDQWEQSDNKYNDIQSFIPLFFDQDTADINNDGQYHYKWNKLSIIGSVKEKTKRQKEINPQIVLYKIIDNEYNSKKDIKI